jgi:hypothetical protein
MESTYEPEIAEPEQAESDAPTFIFLESAEDADVCAPDGECV